MQISTKEVSIIMVDMIVTNTIYTFLFAIIILLIIIVAGIITINLMIHYIISCYKSEAKNTKDERENYNENLFVKNNKKVVTKNSRRNKKR